MSLSITSRQLSKSAAEIVIIDVRKEPARLASGFTIPGSLRRKPFCAEAWWPDFSGRHVAVFCAHGHEVSRAVRGFLEDSGIAAVYLDGGFEAWRAAGMPIEPIGLDA